MIYEQATGRLRDSEGNVIGIGYSGRYPDGKNRPEMDSVKDVGPLPRGWYTVGGPVDTVTHGPYVLPLKPDESNEMHGRTGFLMHGDSVIHPGTASEGCIIQARDVREKVWQGADHRIEVVAGYPSSEV